MSLFSLKKRFIVLIATIAGSVILYFISYYLTQMILHRNFSRFVIKVFSLMKHFPLVIAVDIVILGAATLHLMVVNRLKGNTEYYRGFLYSSYYVALLALVYSMLWITGLF
jgi:hypothetical protein